MSNLKQERSAYRVLFIICFFVSGISISGCASIKEGTKCLIGVSTKVLEDGRKTAVSKSFNYDYKTSYAKVNDALSAIKAYYYKKDYKRHMIAVYFSHTDTTPVGLFFKEIDANNTLIEVSSPSTFAKESVAKRVFARVAGLADPEEELKEKSGVQKQEQIEPPSVEPQQTKRLQEDLKN